MGSGAENRPRFNGRKAGRVVFAATGLCVFSSQSHAAIDLLSEQNTQSFALSALFLAIVVFVWALVVVRKLSASKAAALQKLKSVEGRLNQAEAVNTAEPGILIVWQGRHETPEHVTGDMYDAVRVPADRQEILDFQSWLADESVETLQESLLSLRETGKAFNIGVRNRQGELLEADGRTAGGMATLRFRPLVGERLSTTDLSHEARRLGKQVQRLSAILDQAPLPIWLTDDAGKLVWVNDAYMKAVEIPEITQILEKPVLLVDEAKISAEPSQTGTANGKIGKSDVIIAGNRRVMDLFRVSTGAENANFAVDMTSLDDAQRELDLHIKAHASTLDKLATAIAIFGPDKQLRFYNAAYAKLWEFEPDWLDAHPGDGEILDRLRSERRLPEQANYRAWKNDVLSAYKTLEAKENWWHLPDGRTLRVISEQHPFGGVTYLYENVTEQISLESRYNALIDIQSDTLNNLDEGIALFGSDGKLKLHNVSYSRFWNLPDEFLRNEPHIDDVVRKCRLLFMDDGIWDDLKYCITAINETRKPLQDRISRKDLKVFDVAAIPLPGGNTLVTYLDVTDSAGIERALRERNEALEAADRLKTNFLSNVSYELRTPLTNILGFAEGLSMGIAGELQTKQQEYLGHIQASSDDLLAIIDAILDLTAVDAGAMELKLGEIDVAQLMEAIARSMSEKVKRFDLTLNVEIAENVDRFIADERRITQIFTHLLTNAIGFSPKDGVVRFGAKRDGQHVVMWVSDNGRGMEPEFKKRAFERFQSLPIAGGHRGPGLGLAIVKSFVELHDGQVSLLSKPDMGTTVVCRFPVEGPNEQDGDVARADQALAS